jgi:soluble lytic murein transglycosylase-like protein
MRFCFRLGWVAGLPVFALCAGSLQDQPAGRITSVVHTDRHSGKLVRSMVAAPQPGPPHAGAAEPSPLEAALAEAVGPIAAQHALSPDLIRSVIKVESNYNPYAISPKGAQGLMQLIPATARRFGVADVFNPVENIQGGTRYLKYLMDLYHGDYPLALAAYNAGEEAVARYGGVPPFPETRNYVVQVRKQLEINSQAAAANAKPKEAAVQPLPVEPAGPRHVQEIVEPDGRVRYVSR